MKTNHKQVFKISAGQMFVDNGKVKPNPNKGELRFTINNDNLACRYSHTPPHACSSLLG